MSNFATVSSFLVLFYASINAATIKVFSANAEDGIIIHSSITDDYNICKSLVQAQGYVCEEHNNVTTKDGYILSMQRIPAARSGKAADKPPVLLQHGILLDAAVWLLNSPDESLGFLLADNGFDVWLANTRGTMYGSGHTSMSPNDSAYWEWSWDELALYDLPAFVQYVHDKTSQNLHFVGDSLGTLLALAAFSKQEIVSMIRTAALLAPIAYLDQIPLQPIKIAAEMHFAEGHNLDPYLEEICNKTGSNCSNLMTLFTGPNCCVNYSKTDEFLKFEPQPTSMKNVIHLSQMIRNGSIAMYDYGSKDENVRQYGQPTPPVYDLRSIPIELPLFIAYGGQDLLADVKDVKRLLNDLQETERTMVELYRENYAHDDFILGVNANQLVYDPLVAFFKNYLT